MRACTRARPARAWEAAGFAIRSPDFGRRNGSCSVASHNTIRKVLRSGETSFAYEREVQPQPKLGRWMATLEELLVGNAVKPVRERLTLIRMFEELRERGLHGFRHSANQHASACCGRMHLERRS